MTLNAYCPSCGENVQADLDHEEGREVYRCQFCTLIVRHGNQTGAGGAKTSGGSLRPGSETRVVFPQVLMAEDTALLRQILRDTLLGDRVCEDLTDCRDGGELIEAATGLHRQGKRIHLAIIDLAMPVLNGFHAAVALRAIERAFRAPPTPIVFFTAHGCDDNLRSMLDVCSPARYLNKGSATMDKIAARLAHILQTLGDTH